MGLRWLHYKVEHLYYFGPRSLTRALRQVGLTEVRVGHARKMMNFHYLAHQFAQYPHPLLSPIVPMAHRLSPSSLRKGKFPVSFGELLATAAKPPIGQGGH